MIDIDLSSINLIDWTGLDEKMLRADFNEWKKKHEHHEPARKAMKLNDVISEIRSVERKVEKVRDETLFEKKKLLKRRATSSGSDFGSLCTGSLRFTALRGGLPFHAPAQACQAEA